MNVKCLTVELQSPDVNRFLLALASLSPEALSLNDLLFLQRRAKRILMVRNEDQPRATIRFPPQLDPPPQLEKMISEATSSTRGSASIKLPSVLSEIIHHPELSQRTRILTPVQKPALAFARAAYTFSSSSLSTFSRLSSPVSLYRLTPWTVAFAILMGCITGTAVGILFTMCVMRYWIS